MNKRAAWAVALRLLLDEALLSGETATLFRFLAEQSDLPGPRGNLEMAAALADLAAERAGGEGERLWRLADAMTHLDAEAVPTGDPQEMIPFAGVLVVGALGLACPAYLDSALERLRACSRDPRWRIQEAAAMALQRLLSSPAREHTAEVLETWLSPGDPLPARAVAAAYADPWLLETEYLATRAVAAHGRILALVETEPDRGSDGFRALRQGLAYTLSVAVAAAPEQGFRLLERLARSRDRDVRWIVSRNLTKDRLTMRFPGQVARIVALQDVALL